MVAVVMVMLMTVIMIVIVTVVVIVVMIVVVIMGMIDILFFNSAHDGFSCVRNVTKYKSNLAAFRLLQKYAV